MNHHQRTIIAHIICIFLSISTENRPKSPFLVKIEKKCLLLELKLSDDDDLYLVGSVLMRLSVLFKKIS